MKCPHCKKKIKTIIEWQTCSVGYTRILPEHDYTDDNPIIDGGDFEGYSCPECKMNIDNSLVPNPT